jgi:small subunit ribosomal protein S20
MPNIESARKRDRQSIKHRERNRSVRKSIMTEAGPLLEAIEAGNKPEALKLYSAYASKLDKSAKKGVIKANHASRKKSRLQVRLNAMA